MKPFPPVHDNDMDINDFLDACDSLATGIEVLGKNCFGRPCVYIRSNGETLRKLLLTSEKRHATVGSLLEHEKETGKKPGTDALNGLSRPLDYVLIFMELWVKDYESNSKTNRMADIVIAAYDQTIKKYQAWLVQKAVMYALSGAPDRNAMISSIRQVNGVTAAVLTSEEEKEIFDSISKHAKALRSCMDCLRQNFDAVGFKWQ